MVISPRVRRDFIGLFRFFREVLEKYGLTKVWPINSVHVSSPIVCSSQLGTVSRTRTVGLKLVGSVLRAGHTWEKLKSSLLELSTRPLEMWTNSYSELVRSRFPRLICWVASNKKKRSDLLTQRTLVVLEFESKNRSSSAFDVENELDP